MFEPENNQSLISKKPSLEEDEINEIENQEEID